VNPPLRKAGVVLLVLFAMLFANLNWIQVVKADDYRTNWRNSRVAIAEYSTARGTIEANGTALAKSTATDDELKFLRSYPKGQIYAPIIGIKSPSLAALGIENSENDFLNGQSDKLFADRVSRMFTGEEATGGNVVLSLKTKVQETAWKELTGNERGVKFGSAVAIDPRTGAIQAMVSMPSYDPNPLVSHDAKKAKSAYDKLNADKDKPMLNRATSETYPPGSTMKVIISAAALKDGVTPSTELEAGSSYTAPGSGSPIRNADDGSCPGNPLSLKQSLTHSCNTSYARLGAEKLGRDRIIEEAKAWGFEQTDLTVGDLEGPGLPVTASRTGTMANKDGSEDKAAVAQSSIGQKDVRMTSLQGALMAATVANGGKQMRPYLVQQLLSADRRPIYNANPKTLREPVNGEVAGDLKDMMVNVVAEGTGRKARIEGYTVGGKTGTAENGEGNDPHGWFIGFAFNDKDEPVSAVCVMLQNVSGGKASSEAARIAGLIMKSAAGGGGD
jgi:penicillin-binding protein A